MLTPLPRKEPEVKISQADMEKGSTSLPMKEHEDNPQEVKEPENPFSIEGELGDLEEGEIDSLPFL